MSSPSVSKSEQTSMGFFCFVDVEVSSREVEPVRNVARCPTMLDEDRGPIADSTPRVYRIWLRSFAFAIATAFEAHRQSFCGPESRYVPSFV
jgi:hypothetical protein